MREILVIENDARILDLLTRFLTRRGYQVRRAISLEVAERELALHRPDMILSDLLVGPTHAAGRLRQWAREGKLPPTLVVSGCLDEEMERLLATIPPVVGTLSKPFRFEDLEVHVSAVLNTAPEAEPLGESVGESVGEALGGPLESLAAGSAESQPSSTPCS